MSRVKRAQSVLEYCIFLGVVAAAFGMMQVYAKRGIQAAVKSTADVFGGQEELHMTFSGNSTEQEQKEKLFFKNRESETKSTSATRAVQSKNIVAGDVSESTVTQSDTYFSGASIGDIVLPENITTLSQAAESS